MSKKYRTKTKRSKRKTPKHDGEVVEVAESGVQLLLPIAEILAGVRDSVEAVAGQAGLLVMKALIDDEVAQLVGDRYEHNPDRQAVRHGHDESYVVFAGRKVPFRRPRVRQVGGGELSLDRLSLFQAEPKIEEAVFDRMIRGVSTRNYEGVLDGFCEGYGIDKSSVSRHFKAATQKQLRELMERPLGELGLVALMIDGIEFQGVLLVVALGIAADGQKHVLGFWPGATENSRLVKDLLADLIDRGLPRDRKYLVVLDGAKALRKGVKDVFGDDAIVQRCIQHKERNVLSYLPAEYHAGVKQRLRAAWGMNDYSKAKKALLKVVDYLHGISTSAGRSLEEGFEETLTLHLLRVPDKLRRSFQTTNPIESCFARSREVCRNVKRWRGTEMVMRWGATVLLEAEKGFRRIKGFREMPLFLNALAKGVDMTQAVA